MRGNRGKKEEKKSIEGWEYNKGYKRRNKTKAA
jgi:hypothetical protein